MRRSLLDCVRKGASIVIFDGERLEIPANRVASVHVVVQDLVEA